MYPRGLICLSLLLACDPGEGEGVTLSSTSGTTTDVTTTTTTTTTTTATTTGPTGEAFDCATVSDSALSITEMPQAFGYHDVAFDDEGHIIGSTQTNNALGKTTYDGDFQIWVPNTGTVQQMTRMPDGDLAIASDTRGIQRVSANGSMSTINANISPYGLIMGPDGFLYAAVERDGVYRIDPNTGQSQEIVPNLPRGSPRVINFNLDYTQMYIGTLNGNGSIYVVDLDENLDPISDVRTLTTGIGTGAYHDTLSVDLCGYLYVSDYGLQKVWRIAPDGTNYVFLDAGAGFFGNEHIHGMDWGSGIDGWREDAIYVTKPYQNNRISEIVIGVPSRHWTGGYAINLP